MLKRGQRAFDLSTGTRNRVGKPIRRVSTVVTKDKHEFSVCLQHAVNFTQRLIRVRPKLKGMNRHNCIEGTLPPR